MEQKVKLALLVLLLAGGWFWYDWEHPDTVVEVMERKLNIDEEKILHVEPTETGAYVFYEWNLENHPTHSALGTAYLEGNDEDGWRSCGAAGQPQFNRDEVLEYTMDHGTCNYSVDENGLEFQYIVYGTIGSSAVSDVLIQDRHKAVIIETDLGRIFYHELGPRPESFPDIKALSPKGDILFHQPSV